MAIQRRAVPRVVQRLVASQQSFSAAATLLLTAGATSTQSLPRSTTTAAAAFHHSFCVNRSSLRFMSSSSSLPSGADMLQQLYPTSSSLLVGQDIPHAMESLIQADAVCFDVDSTVIAEEGIDVLADFLGKGEEVAAWTRKAMDGSLKFEEALEARLNLLRPFTKAKVEDLLQQHPPPLSRGISDFVALLRQQDKAVHLVSGGFRIMIEPIASRLDLYAQPVAPEHVVLANALQFDAKGNYISFDETEFTSRDGGKPRALSFLQQTYGYSKMVMVGDGSTDLQAKPPATAFIGYGGVMVREKVKEGADWFVTDFADLIQLLQRFGGK